MIYYPLSTLIMAGIRDILVIATPEDRPAFERLLGDGSQFGISITHAVQESPDGLAQAFVIGADHIGSGPVALVLGDNIFYGHKLSDRVRAAAARPDGATVFAYPVADPERYGVVEFNAQGKVASIVEKPTNPRSRFAVTGLYFYDESATGIASSLKPSERGELEITDVNLAYLERGALAVETLGRGDAWLDTGTPETLLEAGQFIHLLEKRQGLKISCPEEIAWRNGWIDTPHLEALAARLARNSYGEYLAQLAADGGASE
jgi:glucose-1-phosphate thymidylyltransferase